MNELAKTDAKTVVLLGKTQRDAKRLLKLERDPLLRNELESTLESIGKAKRLHAIHQRKNRDFFLASACKTIANRLPEGEMDLRRYYLSEAINLFISSGRDEDAKTLKKVIDSGLGLQKGRRRVGKRRKVLRKKDEEEVLKQLDKLLTSGTPKQWLSLLKRAKRRSDKLELPAPDLYRKPGYRSLLIVIFDSDLRKEELLTLFPPSNKFTRRAIEFLRDLRETGKIVCDPSSSDVGYADDVLDIIGKQQPITSPQEDQRFKRMGFEVQNSKGEKIAVIREIELDKANRAVRVIFRLSSP